MNNSTTQATTEQSPFWVTTAFILCGAAGVGIFLCMPVIGPALVEGLGFSAQQVGRFSFIQLVSISVGCLLGMFATRYLKMRTVACISLIGLLLMDILSPQLESYSMFLAARAVAGISGGMVMALATGALAQMPGVERNFGLFLFAQIVLGMILIWAIPQLFSAFGLQAVFYPLVVLELLVLVLAVTCVPATMFGQGEQSESTNSSFAWVCSGISLVAMLAFFTAIGAYWTFVGLLGGQSGLSNETVSWSLSIATIIGGIGSLTPTFLQQRAGTAMPLIGALLLLLAGIYLTSQQTSFALFTVAAGLFTFGWYVFHPYQLGVLASVDSDGRPTMASAALVGLGLGLGPYLVSAIGGDDLSLVYTVSAIGFIVAAVLLIAVNVFWTRNLEVPATS